MFDKSDIFAISDIFAKSDIFAISDIFAASIANCGTTLNSYKTDVSRGICSHKTNFRPVQGFVEKMTLKWLEIYTSDWYKVK